MVYVCIVVYIYIIHMYWYWYAYENATEKCLNARYAIFWKYFCALYTFWKLYCCVHMLKLRTF